MLPDILYSTAGIVILTVYCLAAAFAVPPVAYWTMTENAKKIMEESGIQRKMSRKEWIIAGVITLIASALFITVIYTAGKQSVRTGMSFGRLSLRFLIFFWMVSVFDAVVLDWWMFSKTDMFGFWLKKQTGKEPPVLRTEPQWDGYEFHKLAGEVILSLLLAWIFIKAG